jgi:hypothetical protein
MVMTAVAAMAFAEVARDRWVAGSVHVVFYLLFFPLRLNHQAPAAKTPNAPTPHKGLMPGAGGLPSMALTIASSLVDVVAVTPEGETPPGMSNRLSPITLTVSGKP